MPISKILETGKRSLLAYQSAINTTSSNIANVNNPNYTRRRAELTQLITGYNSLGLSEDDSLRLRQRYAEKQWWHENQFLGQFDTNSMLLNQIENSFAEDTQSGISSLLGEFWNAWSDLANDPDSVYARNLLRDKAKLLTDGFQRVHSDLINLQEQIVPEIRSTANDINQKTSRLAEINERLLMGKSKDLLDERDGIIADLSKMIDIKIKEKENGTVSVFADGLLLVSDDEVNKMEVGMTTVDGRNRVEVYLADGHKPLTISTGSIGAMIKTHNETIPYYLKKLDDLAKSIADKVNELHRTGENLNGTTNISFFADDVSGAADFRLNSSIENDTSLIASHLVGEGEGSGNLAQAISDLQNERVLNGNTINDYYTATVSELGNQIKENDSLKSSQELIVQQLQNERDSVSAVSIDEEMTKMVQYQQAYQAAAKIVTTVNQMVDTILSLK